MIKRNVHKLTFVFLILAGWNLSLAQFSNLTYLPVGTLEEYSLFQSMSLFQDSRDLIWIGTLGGMDYWDGCQLRSFEQIPFDSSGFSATGVYSFAEDDCSNLWLGTRHGGLKKFDLKQQLFTDIKNPYIDGDHHVMGLKYDHEGLLWVSTDQGLFTYDPAKDHFLPKDAVFGDSPDSVCKLQVFGMECDTLGVLWMTTADGLYCYDKKKKRIERADLIAPGIDSSLLGKFSDVTMDREGLFWIFQGSGELVSFNPYTRVLEFVGPGMFREGEALGFGSVEVDREGKVWFGWIKDLMCFDPRSDQLEVLDFPLSITDIMEDKCGTLFIATPQGVKILDKKGSAIRHYPDVLSLEPGYITSMIRDGPWLWAGTSREGLIRFHTKTGEKRVYSSLGSAGDLSSNFIKRVFKDPQGKIWAFADQDLHLYVPDEERFRRFTFYEGHYITVDQSGDFWISGKNFLVQFNPGTFQTRSFPLSHPLEFEGRGDDFGFIRDSAGYFWLGDRGNHGLFRIDIQSGDWTRYTYDANRPEGIPNDLVHRILYDSQHRIWVATQNGLSRIQSLDGNGRITCTHLFEEDGLTDNDICGLAEDQHGNIWVGTFNGVSVIRKDGSILNLYEGDGLSKTSPIAWALTCDTAGTILVGSVDVTEIPPEYIARNHSEPPVLITDLKLSGRSVRPGTDAPIKKAIRYAERIDLKHDDNFFRIEYAALNYMHPEKNHYRYYLHGVDHDTVEAGNRSYAEYTKVPPGKYHFWVTGSNESRVWNREGIYIPLRIHPPWYKTKAALAAYLLMIAILIYAYIQFRIKRYRTEQLRLEHKVNMRTLELEEKKNQIVEMEQMKVRFFTNISHEIRTPLSLISGPLDNIIEEDAWDQSQIEWLSMIRRNTKRLKHLVTQLLDISKLDAGQMKLLIENVDVVRHVRMITWEFTSLADARNIRLISDFPDNDPVVSIDKEKIGNILNNLVSNALKFTRSGGTVTVRLKLLKGNSHGEPPMLRLIVADTGQGIPHAEKTQVFDRFYRAEGEVYHEERGTGIGLSLTRELVHLMHGEIVLKSLEGMGTIFIVTIPTGLGHLSSKEYTLKKEAESQALKKVVPVPVPLSPNTESPADQGKKLLVVEDNMDLRTFISWNFSSRFNVFEAEEGLAGWQLILEQIPDVIILDVMLPGMNGIKLCEKVKNDERTSHIPVILLTALSTDKDRIEGLKQGADDYISKPFSMEELSVRIQNILDQRERLRKRFLRFLDQGSLTDLKVHSLDEQFLKKLVTVIEQHMPDFNLNVGLLIDRMAMSRSNLFRKVKALTGESPITLIRTMRLKKAAQMMATGNGNITNILLSVGFSSPSYFAKCFKAYFGKSPREYKSDALEKKAKVSD